MPKPEVKEAEKPLDYAAEVKKYVRQFGVNNVFFHFIDMMGPGAEELYQRLRGIHKSSPKPKEEEE